MEHGMLDWLIIGGGVHGTHLSHVIAHGRGVRFDRIGVVDREREPLAAFWRCVAATGMTHLRSPGVHHLDLHPYSLLRFARRQGRRAGGFVPPYDRPTLPLFRAHCEHVVERYRLATLRLVATTEQITAKPWGYRVETTRGHLDTRRVVLALGTGDAVEVPSWAQHAPSWHVFHREFSRGHAAAGHTVAIIGGGISAAQLALSLARTGVQAIVIARHAIREHRFDSDPAWLGPRAMREFSHASMGSRRALIREARHCGSLPPELRRAVKRAIRANLIRWLDAEVTALGSGPARIELVLDRAPHELAVDHVMLATGFRGERPGGELIDDAIDRLGLPCAACGFPMLRDTLEWRAGLYVSGALAELELGPIARNIAKARAAAERLARVAAP
jgi:cation diffusion facilitator CzcD-associated flavoprotein CzcO